MVYLYNIIPCPFQPMNISAVEIYDNPISVVIWFCQYFLSGKLPLGKGDGITPNQLYCADLFAMTTQGAVLARPVSTIRAGEEVRLANALGKFGIPNY